jgi:hypothetical protein
MTSFVQTRVSRGGRKGLPTHGGGDAGLGVGSRRGQTPGVALMLAGSNLPFWHSAIDLGFKPGDWYLRQAT